MRSLTPLLATIASMLGGWPASSSSPSSSFANAQPQGAIAACTFEHNSTCASVQNRTCYSYEGSGEHECGPCLNGFLEFEGDCYDIDAIDGEKWLPLSRLLRRYLPEYVDRDVSDEVRAKRLVVVAKIISFWNSRVPPPEFTLGLTNETFLTEDELRGRLGISSNLVYNLDDIGKRGKIGRFKVGDGEEEGDNEEDGEEEGKDEEAAGDGRMRRLVGVNPNKGRRKLQAAVDWAADGYTTRIKNQGLCGCCWAVATAGAVESALMITNQTSRYDSKDRNSLSFQQMISCDDKELGCQGGNILMATKYVWENNNFNNDNFGGLLSYEDWEYTDFFGTTSTECKAQEKLAEGKTPAAYLDFPQVVNSVNDRSKFNERKERMMAAVAMQPLISVLKSNCPLLMNYKGGVLTHDNGCECTKTSCIDHAIVVVGYDTTAPVPYWKLRNSWGAGWGEGGYFKIAMDNPGVGEWGLFGCLAESAAPSRAYKNLADLPERPGWWQTAAVWEKIVVILLSILGFCCLCGCVGYLRNKHRGSSAE